MIEHYYSNDEIFGENWFSYPNLYKKIVEEFSNGSKFVEVGSWKGRSSSFLAVEIANSKKNIDFYCVDTWEGSVEQKDFDCPKTLYQTFLENMKPMEEYYFPLKITSEEASKKFQDKSLDFVFIDASHEYEDVKSDIKRWLPKIKPGGILAGHDYYVDEYDWFPGVKQAVNEELIGFETSEQCWIYRVSPDTIKKSPQKKLEGLPSIHYITLEESIERQTVLENYFKNFNISNYKQHVFKRISDEELFNNYKFFGPYVDSSTNLTKKILISHFSVLRDWYENTDEPCTLIFEDDVSFETVQYWNFTWKEFKKKLPKNWNCIQLSIILLNPEISEYYQFSVREPWRRGHWSSAAYLVKRKYVKHLLDTYNPEPNVFNFDIKGTNIIPDAESVLFLDIKQRVYVFPLFVYNYPKFYINHESIANQPHIPKSYTGVINWWKTTGKNLSTNQIINHSIF